MGTVLQHSHAISYKTTHQSVWSTFIAWCKDQEENRFMWLAIALAGHGCFLTPLALMAVMLAGNLMILWAFVIGAMAMCLITNLAAMPTKITIPVFILSVLIDLGVVISCIVIPFSVAR